MTNRRSTFYTICFPLRVYICTCLKQKSVHKYRVICLRTNSKPQSVLLTLSLQGPNRERRLQQLFYCCVCISIAKVKYLLNHCLVTAISQLSADISQYISPKVRSIYELGRTWREEAVTYSSYCPNICLEIR
jgi:hypothetical protein